MGLLQYLRSCKAQLETFLQGLTSHPTGPTLGAAGPNAKRFCGVPPPLLTRMSGSCVTISCFYGGWFQANQSWSWQRKCHPEAMLRLLCLPCDTSAWIPWCRLWLPHSTRCPSVRPLQMQGPIWPWSPWDIQQLFCWCRFKERQGGISGRENEDGILVSAASAEIQADLGQRYSPKSPMGNK